MEAIKNMGISASQLRWITLDARKSDLEFQGQQVNQQRMVLANESDTYYAQEAALTVPTAPDGNSTPIYNADGTPNSAWSIAMQVYNAQENTYNASVASINAQLATVQNQDKQLEIQLKNIDTQHDTVQTEMDSVKKVIDKTIDSVFKTYSA